MPHRAGLNVGVCLLLIAGGAGCEHRGASAPNGSASMADTLARIYARAAADPRSNGFLNRERVAALRAVVAQQSGPPALQFRFLLAQEQILAGDTRDGITGLEELIDAAHITLSASTPQNKPFYDLLGVAYLRLGEQENCAGNMAPNICILPIEGAARHVKPEGAAKAIALYERMLNAFPGDRGTQWLLNIAYLALGGYPDRVPPKYLVPGLDARRVDFPMFRNVAGDVGLANVALSGGLCIEDFNHDGLLDVFTTSWGLGDSPHLFLADGHGAYVDRTAAAGLTHIVGGLNCVHADFDNDGNDDLLVLRGAWLGSEGAQPPSLLRNRGNATFEDVTFAAGLGRAEPTHTAAWADFNLDGKLDLFVGHESAAARGGASRPSELYLNNGDGTFTEVSHRVGIDLDDFVKGAVWGDVNNDGLPDLFVSVLFGPNRLYINRGGKSIDSWRFEEVAARAGVDRPLASFTSWFWDYDNDGWDDLLVLSYDIENAGALHGAVAMEYLGLTPMVEKHGMPSPIEYSRLYHNNRDGTFTDVTKQAGLADKVIFAMGANFGDLDNDGWLDFYVGTGNPDLRSVIPNRMFHSVAGRSFEEVTIEGGFGHLQKGHGTAFADLDRDGDEDVYMEMGGAYAGDRFASVLFENPGWPGRHWVNLRLEGRTANRSAIGARVAVSVIDSAGSRRTIYRTIGTGGSFGAGSLELHVGLGNAARIDSVRVTWPDAARSRAAYGGLLMDRYYHIVQGEAPVLLDRPPVPFQRGVMALQSSVRTRP